MVARDRRRTERRRHRARRHGLRLQQRRLRVARGRRLHRSRATSPRDYIGGRIQRVDLGTGRVETLYTECDGHPLRGPNDLVFDDAAAASGSPTTARCATASATGHRRLLRPARRLLDPRGGVPARLAERRSGCRRTARASTSPRPSPAGSGSGTSSARARCADGMPLAPGGGTLLAGLPGFQLLDSLAVDGDGNVCVATLVNGGITVLSTVRRGAGARRHRRSADDEHLLRRPRPDGRRSSPAPARGVWSPSSGRGPV